MEKVKKYEIIDATYEDILSENLIDSRYVIIGNVQKLTETLDGGNKSIKFLYKKTSVGGQFSKAFITAHRRPDGILIFWLLTANKTATTTQIEEKYIEQAILNAEIETLAGKKEIVVEASEIEIPI